MAGSRTEEIRLSTLFDAARDDEVLETHPGLGDVERVLFGRASAPPQPMLGRYVPLERLGGGGYGVVHAAWDPELRRRVALKLLRGRSAEGVQIQQERLIREAQALSQVSHPHVVPIYDIGRLRDADGRPGVFLVMKLVEGPQLDRWLAAHSRSWRDICSVVVQAGRGLAAAHELGIVHRDFKPANVLVEARRRGPHAMVLDFGLAFGMPAAASMPPNPDPADPVAQQRLTAVGSTVGTPLYMSPEQHVDEKLDPRSDQFSLCAVLYEALFGRLPWAGLPLAELGACKGQPPSLPRASGVPARLGALIQRGLAPQPDQRFSSMTALLDALETVPRRRRLRRVSTVLGLAVAVPVGASLVLNHRAEQDCRARAKVAAAAYPAAAEADLGQHFAGLASYGAPTIAWVSGELAGYRDALGTSLVDSCLATRLRGEQSPQAREWRDACLEHRAAALTAVVESLGRADAEAVVSAPSLLSGLPSIEPCREPVTDPDAPAPWLGEHPDLERRRMAADIEMLLRPTEDAAGQLQALAEEAETTGDRALLGRVQLSLGRARSSLVSHEAARQVLHQAVRTAETAGDHETVTRALRRLAIAYQPLDAARFETLLERVAARLEHRPIDTVFAAGVSLSFAHVYALTDRRAQAGQAARAARDAYAEALGPEHPRVAAAVLWIARHLHALSDWDGAREHYAEAARLRTASFGEDHPLVLSVLENLGLLEMAAGEHSRAVEIYQRLFTAQRERFGPEAPATLWAQAALGGATLGTGDVHTGMALVDAALAGLERSSGAGTTAHAELLYHVAHWLSDAGRAERARIVATRAVTMLEASVTDDHPTLTRARTYLRQLQEVSP